MEVLRLENVSKKYGELLAVKDLSFSVEEGELFVILGPSGAGKTTTLKMISGIEEVTKGEIYIKGKLVNSLEPKDRKVSMVFENYALYPHLSVYKNISSPLEAQGLPQEEIEKKVLEIARLLQIDGLLSRPPALISGGQKQRVVLARALVKDADIYLMDEPIAHLDAKLRHQMRGEFKRFQHMQKMTMVYVTHDFREALSLGNRILVLNKGITQQIGTPEEIFNKPANTFVASLVGEPPMNLLEGVIKKKDENYFFQINDIFIPLSYSLANKIISKISQEKVILGIRPFDLHCVLGKMENVKIPEVEVYVTELVGHYNIVSVKLGDTLLKIREDKSFKVSIGEKISIDFEEDKLHFFDGVSGNRIS
ncbi:MAG: ABC transporter ATP-binding protein [Dictyoglomaceae bacterium]